MSTLVAGVLKMTVGLLWKKARSNTAKKLQEGDLTDEKCRQLIIRELDDIKAKIDGLARKDLIASMNFLEEGLVLFNQMKDDLAIVPRRGRAGQVDGVSSMALAEEVPKINFKSNKNYIQAKESFKASNMKATEAFSNEALTIEDRITATKLCVASRMLMSIENADGGIQACMLYLERLHSLQGIKETFSVYLFGGWKSLLKTTQRLEHVISVTKINFAVYDFVLKFGSVKLLDWPSISIKGNTYNPIMADENVLVEIDCPNTLGERLHAQTQDQASIHPPVSVVNSSGEIIVAHPNLVGELSINTRLDKQKVFCSLTEKDAKDSNCQFHVVDLAIDSEDKVYALTIYGPPDNFSYKLFCVDSSGVIKSRWSLKFIKDRCKPPKIAVGADDKIVVAEGKHVYVCDTKDCEVSDLEAMFHFQCRCDVRELCISNNNEIIISSQRSPTEIHMYTMQGKRVNRFKLPAADSIRSFAFNYTRNDIVVYASFKSSNHYLLRYSIAGEQLQTLNMASFSSCWTLKSHASGPVVLLSQTKVLHLQ